MEKLPIHIGKGFFLMERYYETLAYKGVALISLCNGVSSNVFRKAVLNQVHSRLYSFAQNKATLSKVNESNLQDLFHLPLSFQAFDGLHALRN